jgi:hypothetical protein
MEETRTQIYVRKVTMLTKEYEDLLNKPFPTDTDLKRLEQLSKTLRLVEFFVQESGR